MIVIAHTRSSRYTDAKASFSYQLSRSMFNTTLNFQSRQCI
jgi:hypothetical protein